MEGSSPKLWTPLGQIKHLSWVEQPLEGLHELGTLIPTTLGIKEHQHWLAVTAGQWLHLNIHKHTHTHKHKQTQMNMTVLIHVPACTLYTY